METKWLFSNKSEQETKSNKIISFERDLLGKDYKFNEILWLKTINNFGKTRS